MKPVMLVQGGAGDIPDDRVDGKFRGVKRAVRIGNSVLQAGGSAVDAVEAAVKSMELDEYFNAGYGSVLTIEGNVEMSASIMRGDDLEAGAVGYLKNVAHPISLARMVMEKTPHVMLVGEGATHFAVQNNVAILPEGSLVTEFAKESLGEFLSEGGIGRIETGRKTIQTKEGGTVGAVAMDANGHIAAATSTGGITGKLRGRVGDTPQLGCGTYADKHLGAVSTTGHGESILKANLAYSILIHLQSGKTAFDATKAALDVMKERLGQGGGAITLGPTGDIGVYHNSKRMAWASIAGGVLNYGIEQDQSETEQI